MSLILKQYGHNITADGTFPVPESTQGWIANNTDVPITLTLSDGTEVDLNMGQTHMWQQAFHIWETILVTVTGMSSGWVGIVWGV